MLKSRRSFLAGVSGAILCAQTPLGKGRNFASDAQRYADPATEFIVTRLTSPQYESRLTAYYNRAMMGRNTLLFSNDRTGRFEVHRADFKNGQTRQLSSAERLDPASIALLANDHALCYFDGPSLRELNLSTLRDRELYRVADGVERPAGFSVAADGSHGFFVEKSADGYRLRSVDLARGTVATLVEGREELTSVVARQGHPQVTFSCAGATWLTGADGKSAIRLTLAPGEALAPRWPAEGESLLYINLAQAQGQLNSIREFSPAGGTDKLVAKTSQFVAFGANADASVFVGASGSKASPHVLILLRQTRRELTLCEHRARDARAVAPVFAPSSQRIVFASDRHGKQAIYTMSVERFVEETES